MQNTTPSHASLHKRADLSIDPATGECRIAVVLWQLDRQLRDVPLVLSPGEAWRLLVALLGAFGLPAGPSREVVQ